ncbi:MAG: phosphoenolpyruvate synthase [Calothrix sp. FI2-JRJ7]|nr:phosphoenolpyruvate synthase [Calothrix sp. FI2-JRJ7]
MERLYWLNQIEQQDLTQVGDKAFNLGRLLQLRYPVAPGFVVAADVTREFLLNLDTQTLITDLPYSELHLDITNWRQLQQVASSLRQEIMIANVASTWVKVIFDAASQWQANCLIFRPTVGTNYTNSKIEDLSELLESQVCWCNITEIALALKRSWSQLFRARSLLYCNKKGIDLRQVNFGILVQPLWDATKSGLLVANSSGLEVQANWGLGNAIDSGEVNGDYYKIKPDGVIIEKSLGDKILAYKVKDCSQLLPTQTNTIIEPESSCVFSCVLDLSEQQKFALSQTELQELLKLANQLTNQFGTSFSYKWTIAKNNGILYLTQVTPLEYTDFNSQLVIKGLGAASGQVTGTAYVITNFQEKPQKLPSDTILVASSISIDWLPLMRNCKGIITEVGGLTSHAAILARELGIPSLVNANKATELIKNGDKLSINGDNGEINKVKFNTISSDQDLTEITKSKQSQDFSTQIPTSTQLMVNLSQAHLIEQIQSLPIDGVGLLRSELMAVYFLNEHNLSILQNQERRIEFHARWSELIISFAKAFTPRPIFYRSLDLRFNVLEPTSTSQSLGERGTLSYVQNPEIFEFELGILAQVQQAGFNNLRLILPFVRSVEEFIFCRQKVESSGLTHVPQFQLWIMAEVPSVLFMLPEYIKAGVQGIAIGTNDLTQLLLGVDRELQQLRNLNECHPAVMRAIKQLIETARSYNIPCSICGQAPVLYPEIIDQLVQWGITSISVEPEAILRTHHAIARAEQRIILEAARRKSYEL